MRSNLRLLLPALLLAACLAAIAAPLTVEKTFSPTELRAMRRDRHIDVMPEPGAVALTPFELLCDSTGYTENGVFNEVLSDRVWAKKEFVLDDPRAKWVQLYFGAASDKVRITVNGRQLTIGDPKSWPYGNWATVDVPPDCLRRGMNEVVFSGEGMLYVDNCLFPNRSARSQDGGKTWDYDHLGRDGEFNGEYMVRLGLGRYPGEGTLWSDGVDLAALAGPGPIAPLATPLAVQLAADTRTPDTTAVRFELRSGTSPEYDPERWAAWRPAAPGAWLELPATHRYAQWRAVLTTANPLITPLLRSVTLRARLDVTDAPKIMGVERFENQQIIRSSYPFVYQRPSSRVSLLRKMHKLDEVVAGKKTELEQLVALRDWTRKQWGNGWSRGELDWCPAPDALLMLDMAPRGKVPGFCGHYAWTFVQCAITQGYTGRMTGAHNHAYSEVWSNDFRKWVLMDVGPAVDDRQALNYHYELNGVPMTALELHKRLPDKDWAGVTVVPSNPADRWDPYKDEAAMRRYEMIIIPFRNNLLDSMLPGSIDSQGWLTDTEWLMWRDGPVQELHPRYPYTTNRAGDMYWTLNQVAIYPSHGNTVGTLHLEFDTVTPNFDRYEVRLDGGEWKKCGETFDWALRLGMNKLEARTVNAFGKPGIVSLMEVNNHGK